MDKLRQFDWAFLALILLGLRSLYDANASQAVIVACFAGLVGFKRWMDSLKQKDIDAELRQELDRMKNVISGISMKNSIKKDLPENTRFF